MRWSRVRPGGVPWRRVPSHRAGCCAWPPGPRGGVDTLLTAFGLLVDDHPELSAEVVGTGPLSRVLRSHADHLGLAERVRFRGRLAPPAVRGAVRGCAVLACPTGTAPLQSRPR